MTNQYDLAFDSWPRQTCPKQCGCGGRMSFSWRRHLERASFPRAISLPQALCETRAFPSWPRARGPWGLHGSAGLCQGRAEAGSHRAQRWGRAPPGGRGRARHTAPRGAARLGDPPWGEPWGEPRRLPTRWPWGGTSRPQHVRQRKVPLRLPLRFAAPSGSAGLQLKGGAGRTASCPERTPPPLPPAPALAAGCRLRGRAARLGPCGLWGAAWKNEEWELPRAFCVASMS